jgi:hypothetical protein
MKRQAPGVPARNSLAARKPGESLDTAASGALMPKSSDPIPFRLSTGGLVYLLGSRFRLFTESEYRSRRLFVLFVVVTWVPLIVFSAFEGTLAASSVELNLLADLKPHVRCLILIPLLAFAGSIIDPILSTAINGFRESGIIADEGRTKFDAALAELRRRRDDYLPDAAMLVITAALTWAFISGFADLGIEDDTSSWMKVNAESRTELTAAGWWYLLVISPIMQIMLYRWFWRFVIWAGFLYRLSRINLSLEPTHPDLAGGLGALQYTQGAFTLIFIAFGVMISVSVAQEIMTTDLTLSDVTPLIIGYVIACIALESLPLLFFTSQLIDTKRQGRRAYGALGLKLTRAFDASWADKDKAGLGEDLLQAMDASAMADYSAVYENVKGMRIIPTSLRSYALQAAALAAPFLPLIFIEIPFAEVMGRLLDSLV